MLPLNCHNSVCSERLEAFRRYTQSFEAVQGMAAILNVRLLMKTSVIKVLQASRTSSDKLSVWIVRIDLFTGNSIPSPLYVGLML